MSVIAKVKSIVYLNDTNNEKKFRGRGDTQLDRRIIPLDPYINSLVKLCFIVINGVTSATSNINFVSIKDCDEIHTWKPTAARFILNKIYKTLNKCKDLSKITDTQINPWCIRWSSCTECTYGKRNGICSKYGSVISNILSNSGFNYKQLVEIPELLPSIIDFLDKNSKLTR